MASKHLTEDEIRYPVDVKTAAAVMAKDEDLEHYPYRVTPEMFIEAAERLNQE